MDISLQEVLLQAVNFLLLFVVLRAFAWKRILSFLDKRKALIAGQFQHIRQGQDEIARLKSEYEAKIGGLDKEAQKIIQGAVEQGRKITAEIRKDAYLQSQEILETARQEIKYELGKAKEELKEEIINISIGAAETVIQEKLTEDEDRKIVKEFVDRIDTIE